MLKKWIRTLTVDFIVHLKPERMSCFWPRMTFVRKKRRNVLSNFNLPMIVSSMIQNTKYINIYATNVARDISTQIRTTYLARSRFKIVPKCSFWKIKKSAKLIWHGAIITFSACSYLFCDSLLMDWNKPKHSRSFHINQYVWFSYWFWFDILEHIVLS